MGCLWRIYVSFLSIGHTCEDIDQSFLFSARRLRASNGFTLAKLHDLLRQSYPNLITVTAMRRVANISNLFERRFCKTLSLPSFSHHSSFHFVRQHDKTSQCYLRDHLDGERKLLHSKKDSFLSHVPVFQTAPGKIIICPNCKEDVSNRIIWKKVKSKVDWNPGSFLSQMIGSFGLSVKCSSGL